MINKRRIIIFHLWALTALTIFLSGCSQLQIPAFDPTGSRIFLPAPFTTSILPLGTARNSNIAAYNTQVGSQFGTVPGGPLNTRSQFPTQPAFSQPNAVPSCQFPNNGCISGTRARKHIIPNPNRIPKRGESGEIILSPHRIIAPVGSEVVVLAGICGGDGFYALNQPLEWILSNNSVGQLIEVGGMEHRAFNRFVPPQSKKFDGQYAWGRTGLKEKLITRGTPTPADDISILKGQTYVSLSSASPGTSYLTSVAPAVAGWDKRRASTTIHWVDGIWSIPLPTSATAGTVHPLTTLVKSATDEGGVSDWKVKYTIVGGAPAEFAPTGSETAEAITGTNGTATAQIRQPAGQFVPGTTQVRVDVIRPAILGERELLVESGITSVTWSAPALTIRAIGPKQAGSNESFNYRVEVSNPGDQIARDVVVRTSELSNDLTFISSDPKPTQFGRDYEWKLGDISPGTTPKTINVQLKSQAPGTQQICFDVASTTDQLNTQACAETEIIAPCIGLQINGPEEASVGTQATFDIQIVNQCEVDLENVVLNVQYDEQLRPIEGLGRVIEANIGDLAFGESQSVSLTFDALEAGSPCFYLRVAADGGHTARAKQCVLVDQVTQPQVTMQLDGGRLTEVGPNATTVRARIKNTGTQALDQVILTNKFSPSLTPRFITKTYPWSWLGEDIGLSIGELAPGQEAVVEIVYDALEPDGNAFSELTLSSPDGVSVTDRFEIRIESAGGGLPGGTQNNDGAGGTFPDFGSGAGPGTGGQTPPNFEPNPGLGNVGPDNGGPGNGGQIAIPSTTPGTGLFVDVESLDQNVRASQRGDTSAPAGRFVITVVNNRESSDQNVDIALLVPPGIWLKDFDTEPGNLRIVRRNADFTQFILERRLELRPGERLQFTAFIAGDRVGEGTFEVQATSDNTVGIVSDAATIEVVN